MRSIFIGIILLVGLMSCSQNPQRKIGIVNSDTKSLKISQHTIQNLIEDLKVKKVNFNYYLKKYYFRYNELQSHNLYETVNESIIYKFSKLINNTDKTYQLYWNDEIDSVNTYSWLNDSAKGKTVLLILENGDLNTSNYYGFSFTKKGKIYSNMPIWDSKNDSTIWLRNQQQYLTLDPVSGDSLILIHPKQFPKKKSMKKVILTPASQ